VSQYAATGRAVFSEGTLYLFERRLNELALAGEEEDWGRIKELSAVLHQQRMGAVRERMAGVSERRAALKERAEAREVEKEKVEQAQEKLEAYRRSPEGQAEEQQAFERHVENVMFPPLDTEAIEDTEDTEHAEKMEEQHLPHAKAAKAAKDAKENRKEELAGEWEAKGVSSLRNQAPTTASEAVEMIPPSSSSLRSLRPLREASPLSASADAGPVIDVPTQVSPSREGSSPVVSVPSACSVSFPAARKLEMLPYQRAFAHDPSRFKIALWARQTGKDFTAAAEAVYDCSRHANATWIILAAGERQALETLAQARAWAETIQAPPTHYAEKPLSGWEPTAASGNLSRTRLGELTWRNGSRLLALPANPQTIRGYSANLILTEFAFHENADEIWKAIYPAISNPLSGGGVKKLRILSTPNGPQNKFAQLWREAEGYVKSKVTIHDAIRDGLPINAAELEKHLADPDAWQQEYLCEFAEAAAQLLPYELITPCESVLAQADSPLDALRPRSGGQLFAGIDFGRKEHLTVCWIVEKVGAHASPHLNPHLNLTLPGAHCYVTREVLVLRNASTPEQLEQLKPRLRLCQRACLDSTGAGTGLADYLTQEFGEYAAPGRADGRPPLWGKIELCPFTRSLKNELFPKLRAAFEQREVAIPIQADIREDLHALHRRVSAEGNVSYRAEHAKDGHADRATALALALRAGNNIPVSRPSSTPPPPPKPPRGHGQRHDPEPERFKDRPIIRSWSIG